MRLVGELVHRAPFGKSICQIKVLRSISDHSCVLFVQHILENSQPQAFQCRSIVACARLFGNCHVATEGASRGRPVGWFALVHPDHQQALIDNGFLPFPILTLYRVFVRNSTLCKQAADGHLHRPAGKDSCSSAIRAKSQARLREPVARCRANSLSHLNPISKKMLENQWLDRLCRCGVRVNCATHDGKPSIGRAPTQFLYCVCRSLR